MYFKTVSLTAIRNKLKQTTSANGELGLLQMVSEPNTEMCANKNVGLQGGRL